MASTATGLGGTPLPPVPWVQIAKPGTSSAPGGATRRAMHPDPVACRSPLVLTARNVAPYTSRAGRVLLNQLCSYAQAASR
jgi:hypothetical protein